ncbi:MAG: PA domain-containing protein, partial [Verrucomicrobiia bacterium]
LVFGGRTGGANQNQHIDSIRLTTIPADKALVGNATADAVSVTVTLEDAGASVVDQSTVTMTVDGAPATPLSFSKEGATTTVKWNSPTYLPSGKDLAVVVSFKDTRGVDITATRTAKVAAYARIPAEYMVPTASVNKSKPGFLLRPYQTEAAQPNSLMWTEEQLLGLHGENIADLTGATGGYYIWEGILNFNIDAPTPVGNFSSNNGYEDQYFPGFPGTTSSTGNSTEEVLTYVEFPTAGLYQLGVNSDDGFRVTAGRAPGDLLGVILGYFDGGRGAADTVFSVVVDPPGIYPIRLIWENGSGELPGNGANLEFFSVKDGVKIPVNDTVAGALKAYRESTAAGPHVTNLWPLRGATGVAGNAVIMAEISQGSVQVDPSTMKMKLNGVEVPATVTTAGSKTTITRSATDLLPSASTQTVRIEFSDKSNPPVAYSTEWTFTVAAYSVLSEDLWTALGTGDATKPGFKARVWQLDQVGSNTIVNRTHRAEQELAGIIGPNVADLSQAIDGWFYCDVINWDQDLAGNGNFGAPTETAIPGIPGNTTGGYPTDNIAAEIITYVEFPAAGFYGMGVNSDDGFKVTATDTPPANNLALVITSPASIAGAYHAISAPAATAKPWTYGVSGKLVRMDPTEGCSAAVNADALRGNIALVDRGTCQFSTKIKNAKNAGAIAVVVVNNRPVGHAEGIWPIEMGVGDDGYQDIPAVMISMPDGDKIKTGLASGVTASITPDTTPALGEFDGGRGASDTLFYFIVPKAGLYPFRCVWYEGNGGANIEWFSVTSSGQKILINDADNPAALKSYYARTAQPQPKPVISSIALKNGNVVITYTGVLQAADEVIGPYSDVAGTSPQTIAPTAAKKFYRARSQ